MVETAAVMVVVLWVCASRVLLGFFCVDVLSVRRYTLPCLVVSLLSSWALWLGWASFGGTVCACGCERESVNVCMQIDTPESIIIYIGFVVIWTVSFKLVVPWK